MKLLIILLTPILVFSSTINEHKVDLYFANGAGGTYDYAKRAEDNIHTFMESHNRFAEIKDSIQEFDQASNRFIIPSKLSYNNTYGTRADLTESAYQITESRGENFEDLSYSNNLVEDSVKSAKIATGALFGDWLSFLMWIRLNVDSNPQTTWTRDLEQFVNESKLSEGQKNFLKNTFNLANPSDSEWILIIKTLHEFDLENHVQHYLNDLKNGHRIVVLAHSQGSVFTNEAYLRISKENHNPRFQAYFIAPISDSVLGFNMENKNDIENDYIIFDNDQIVKNSSLALKPSMEGPNQDSAHFLNDYMNYAGSLIIDKLADKILNKGPSIFKKESSSPDLCEPVTVKNPYTGELFDTLQFHENGLINTTYQLATAGSSKIEEYQSLENNATHCYKADNNETIEREEISFTINSVKVTSCNTLSVNLSADTALTLSAYNDNEKLGETPIPNSTTSDINISTNYTGYLREINFIATTGLHELNQTIQTSLNFLKPEVGTPFSLVRQINFGNIVKVDYAGLGCGNRLDLTFENWDRTEVLVEFRDRELGFTTPPIPFGKYRLTARIFNTITGDEEIYKHNFEVADLGFLVGNDRPATAEVSGTTAHIDLGTMISGDTTSVNIYVDGVFQENVTGNVDIELSGAGEHALMLKPVNLFGAEGLAQELVVAAVRDINMVPAVNLILF